MFEYDTTSMANSQAEKDDAYWDAVSPPDDFLREQEQEELNRPSPKKSKSEWPDLELGSDREIAVRVVKTMRGRGVRQEVPFDEGQFWYFDGYWTPYEEREIRRRVEDFDGAYYPCGDKKARIRMTKAKVDSIVNFMTHHCARPDFFANAPVGLNCQNGFSCIGT